MKSGTVSSTQPNPSRGTNRSSNARGKRALALVGATASPREKERRPCHELPVSLRDSSQSKAPAP